MKQSVQTGLKESTLAVVRMKDQMETKQKIKTLEEQQKQDVIKNIECHLKVSE